MNKVLLVVICVLALSACSSMQVRPTVGVSVDFALIFKLNPHKKQRRSAVFF